MQLKVSTPGNRDYQSWGATFDSASDDIQIDVETCDGKKISRGEILLVGGRVMATSGSIAEAGYEGDALDAAVLQMRLVIRLLGEIAPNGPGEISGDRQVDLKKDKTGIQFATPGAQGFIAAPWRVTGGIKHVARDHFSFDLTLTASSTPPRTGQNGSFITIFTGDLSNVPSARIDDGMLLKGWDVFTIGHKTRKDGKGRIIDSGETPSEGEYRLVSDLRKKIAADEYPGEHDSSKNFTGFWKENCDQAFGLQIMPFGNDGKYSVTFCGPGGCGKAGEEGKNTFITKDPGYEVVNESELKIRNAENGWDTYFRCTKDTHPILKYKDQP